LLGEAAVFALVYRAPSRRTLACGLAASVLVAFCLLTTMHERYAFAALAFLVLAFPDRRAAWLALAFGIVFTLNLLAAVPPTAGIAAALPVSGGLGIAGSLAMLAISGAILAELAARSRRPARPTALANEEPPPGDGRRGP
jgi:hypothetical protein